MNNDWTIKDNRVLHPDPFCLAGIVNITPDSFSDGGCFFDQEKAVRHGLQLLSEGAGMLDLGAESTRPYAKSVAGEEERARLLPVLKELRRLHPEAILSIDTIKAETARQALEAGADIINDVMACRVEPALRDVLVAYKPGYVLMHSQGTPQDMQKKPSYHNVTEEIFSFFEAELNALVRAGLPEDRVVLDPGIGFGKNAVHTRDLLQNLERFSELGRPLYVGLSRKSMFRDLLGLEQAQERNEATHLAVALLGARGIPYHRVHDVAGCAQALCLTAAITPGLSENKESL